MAVGILNIIYNVRDFILNKCRIIADSSIWLATRLVIVATM